MNDRNYQEKVTAQGKRFDRMLDAVYNGTPGEREAAAVELYNEYKNIGNGHENAVRAMVTRLVLCNPHKTNAARYAHIRDRKRKHNVIDGVRDATGKVERLYENALDNAVDTSMSDRAIPRFSVRSGPPLTEEERKQGYSWTLSVDVPTFPVDDNRERQMNGTLRLGAFPYRSTNPADNWQAVHDDDLTEIENFLNEKGASRAAFFPADAHRLANVAMHCIREVRATRAKATRDKIFQEVRATRATVLQGIAKLAKEADEVHPFLQLKVLSPMYVRHVRTRGEYRVLGYGKLQSVRPIADMTAMVAYTGTDGKLWVRPLSEFEDGRFETLEGDKLTPIEPVTDEKKLADFLSQRLPSDLTIGDTTYRAGTTLHGIKRILDAGDQKLPLIQQLRILNECLANPWFFTEKVIEPVAARSEFGISKAHRIGRGIL